ncbi:Groucho/TLE Q-rich domain protein [Trichuris suis]|nr:Groucho/TLE Q-rich domain protein [Trichuris suis]
MERRVDWSRLVASVTIMYPNRHPGPPQPGQPFKFTVIESCDRIKEEFNFLQAQYHSLKLECEKLAQEKTEMQRHYIMYYEMSYGLNVEMHKQTEIAKRLNAILLQVIPFLSQEHQQQVIAAVDRAKQVTASELNTIIGQQMHAQQLAAHAVATGSAMGPPGLPTGLGPSHSGLTPSSLPPGISSASLAASGLLSLPNPLAAQLSGFPTPLPPCLKDERSVGSARPASVDERLPVSAMGDKKTVGRWHACQTLQSRNSPSPSVRLSRSPDPCEKKRMRPDVNDSDDNKSNDDLVVDDPVSPTSSDKTPPENGICTAPCGAQGDKSATPVNYKSVTPTNSGKTTPNCTTARHHTKSGLITPYSTLVLPGGVMPPLSVTGDVNPGYANSLIHGSISPGLGHYGRNPMMASFDPHTQARLAGLSGIAGFPAGGKP